MFKIEKDKIEPLSKIQRTSGGGKKSSGVKEVPNYDAYLNVVKQEKAGAVKILNYFQFGSRFIRANKLDHTWKVSKDKGVPASIAKREDSLNALVGFIYDGKALLGLVPETFTSDSLDIHAFGPVGKEAPKATKVVLTTITEFLQAAGIVKAEVGEKDFFKLVPEVGEDGTEYSDDTFLKVFSLEKVEPAMIPAPQVAGTQASLPFSAPVAPTQAPVVVQDSVSNETTDEPLVDSTEVDESNIEAVPTLEDDDEEDDDDNDFLQ